MNQYELAKLADLEDWYLTLYTLFSFSAHGSVADLEKHIVVGADGVVLEFKSEPELSGQAPVWAWVSEVLIMAMRSLLKVFALEDPQIEVLFKKLASLANDNAA